MMHIPEPLSMAIFWGALLGSLVFSIWAAVESWREYFDVRWTYEQAKNRSVNGQLKIARFRKRGGFWYVVGFNLMAGVFILITYRAITEPTEPNDALVVAAATRLLALVVVFSFWRTMRGQREIRRELREADEIAEVKKSVAGVRDLQEKTYNEVRDVNEKVSGQDRNREVSDEGREVSDEGRRVSDASRRVSDEGRRVTDDARTKADEARTKADEARATSDEARDVSDKAREEERG